MVEDFGKRLLSDAPDPASPDDDRIVIYQITDQFVQIRSGWKNRDHQVEEAPLGVDRHDPISWRILSGIDIVVDHLSLRDIGVDHRLEG